MVEFIKKNYIKIVMILLVLFSFSMCAKNCSNKNKLRTNIEAGALLDQNIKQLEDSIVVLNITIKDLKNDLSTANSKVELLTKSNDDLNKALGRKVVVNISQEEKNAKEQ